MTYIDYLNRFHRWSESHYLPASSKLLYLCMLDLFNRSMWAESIQIDNLRLTILAGVSTEKTAIKARDNLVKNGLISYKKGSKGNPGVYGLLEIHCKNYSEFGSESDSDSYSIYDSECNSENDSKTDSLSDGKIDRHIKKNTEKETYNKPPISPKEGSRKTKPALIPKQEETGFSDDMQSAFVDWLLYKTKERKQPYKEIGLRNLISTTKKNLALYGEAIVIDVISRSISAGYTGIVWDWCKKMKEEQDKQERLRREAESRLPF